MKKYLLILGLFLCCFSGFADEVVTTFPEAGAFYVESSLENCKARAYNG